MCGKFGRRFAPHSLCSIYFEKKLFYAISLERGCCFGTCLEIRKVLSSTLRSPSFIFLSDIHVSATT
jgi:hypothetical protein